MFANLCAIGLIGVLIGLSSASPIVLNTLTNVTYVGTTSDGVEHFQNIKFAHDTSGIRRFAPPEPFIPPAGSEQNATSPGAACPQVRDTMPPFFAETQEMSEDCLNLRISRPGGITKDEKLPVVVWIHGGGVVKGSAYDPHTDPHKLIGFSISSGKPIIFVAINYRLSIFGFANLPLLKENKALNLGIRDQRLGFQWVKDSIEHFGGNPVKITAYGLSAGGTFISLHLTSYGGELGVPFNQAWVMSGPPGTALNMSSDATIQHTMAVANELNCDQTNDEDLLNCMRDTSMNQLLGTTLEYAVANHPPAGLFTFIPVVDEDLFPDRQSVLYREGRVVKGMPVVLGWAEDDGALNVGPAHLVEDEKDIIKRFAHNLTEKDYAVFLALYNSADLLDDLDIYNEKDMLFTCSSIDFGFHLTKFSREDNPSFSDVRLYNLNQSMLEPLWKAAGMPYIRVSHGSDTNFIFAGLFPEGEISSADMALAEEMTSAFLSFAYTGNPNENGKYSNAWPEAFSEQSTWKSTPYNFSVRVFGGNYGTSAVNLQTGQERQRVLVQDHPVLGSMQQVVHAELELFRTWGPSDSRLRDMQRQRLLQQCEFINSLAEKLGV